MSPSKPTNSPTKNGFNDVNNPFFSASPTKRDSVKNTPRRLSTDDEDEKLDTRSLLERMKETVEGMKRRRSISMSTPSPAKPPSGSILPEKVYTPFTVALTGASESADATDIDQSLLLRPLDRAPASHEVEIDETENTPEFTNQNIRAIPTIFESVTAEKPPAQELLQREPVCPTVSFKFAKFTLLSLRKHPKFKNRFKCLQPAPVRGVRARNFKPKLPKQWQSE